MTLLLQQFIAGLQSITQLDSLLQGLVKYRSFLWMPSYSDRAFAVSWLRAWSGDELMVNMENYSGLLPFLWKTFKTKPQERKRAPEMQPLSLSMSMPHLTEDDEEDMMTQQDDEYFLMGKSPKSNPGVFGRMASGSPARASSPARTHRRRHSTGLSSFSLPKMLSSNSLRHRWAPTFFTPCKAPY